ncbi:hypothetical protein ACP4OV_001394 [Aristida adscensionis]
MSGQAAIASTMSQTRHASLVQVACPPIRKAKESLEPVYVKNSKFKAELHELLDEVISVDEFEIKWVFLIEKYNLHGNGFLERAYDNREMWAKPYFADTFCAGMTRALKGVTVLITCSRHTYHDAPH